MQIIKCDECENLFKLPQDAIERLERVKKAGSGSIYLECPYCKEKTSFNRFTTIYTDASLLSDNITKSDETIQYDLLPKEYEQYIAHNDTAVTIRGEQYKLYSIQELFKNINIDGDTYLQIKQLKGFSNSLYNMSEISNEEHDILSNSLSLGEGDGSILFASQKEHEYALSVFYIDGAYIENLELTLNYLIKNELQSLSNSKPT